MDCISMYEIFHRLDLNLLSIILSSSLKKIELKMNPRFLRSVKPLQKTQSVLDKLEGKKKQVVLRTTVTLVCIAYHNIATQ